MTEIGFYPDIPEDEYHSGPGISKSGLDVIARSPAHYKHAPPKESTRNMDIGSAIHCALLEPERFQKEYIMTGAKDRRVAEYKDACKAADPSKVLTEPEANKVQGMMNAVYAQPHARKALAQDGDREMSAYAHDPETGVLCRCRFDLITHDGKALDLKKTQDARDEPFSRSVFNYRYHVQAAFYSDVYYWITGKPLSAYAFLAVEEDPPHYARIIVLDDESMDLGRRLYRRDLNTYAQCIERNEWPYPDDGVPSVVSLPGWAIKKTDEELGE